MLSKIHPKIILYILDSFGFMFDLINLQIVSVDYWIKNLLPNILLSNTDKFIKTNTKTIQLLNCLVKFINELELFKSMYLQQDYDDMIKQYIPGASDTQIYNVRFNNIFERDMYLENVKKSQQDIDQYKKYNQYSNSFNNLNVLDMFNLTGGNKKREQYLDFSDKAIIAYNELKNRLHKFNKKIGEKDEINFSNMISNLKIYQGIANEYAYHLNRYPNTDSKDIQDSINNLKKYYGEIEKLKDKIIVSLEKIDTITNNLNRINKLKK